MSAIDGLKGVSTGLLRQAYEQGAMAVEPGQGSGFAERLRSMMEDVDSLQDHSLELQQALLSGESMDVHEVMIAGQEAGLAFDLMLEIRNKLMEAYQEIMRLQA